MIPIFYINLDKRPDRNAQLLEQLSALKLSAERISAVVGKDLTIEQQQLFDKDGFTLQQKKEPVLGEIGCAMSHRLIWQKMLDDDLDYALIMEDDVNIDSKLVDFLNDKQHYEGFDFLNLSFTKPYQLNQDSLNFLRKNNVVERPYFWQSRKLWKKLEAQKGFKIFKLYFYEKFVVCECNFAPSLGSGYIVSKLGAKLLLETSQKMTYPIDLTWYFVGNDRMIQGFIETPLITQVLGDTDIQGRYVGYKLSFWQKIQRIFRKNRFIGRKIGVIKMYGLFCQ